MNLTQWLPFKANETTENSIVATSAGVVFTVFPGDTAGGKAAGKPRAELFNAERLVFEQPVSFDISFTIPETWEFTEKSAATVWQIHSTPDEFDVSNRSACLTCYLVGDKFKWRLRHDLDLKSTSKPEAVLLFETPCIRGKRYDWKVCFSPLSYIETGQLNLFLDGEVVGSHTGPNCYHDLVGPYVKFGCYVPQFPDVPYRAVIYHKMKQT